MARIVLLPPESCLKWFFCGGAAARYDANLGAQPGGLAGSYANSQQPTTIVSVFVDGEICHSNPSCGGSVGVGGLIPRLRGFYVKRIQSPNIEPLHELDKKHPACWRGGGCKSPTLCYTHVEQLLCKNSFFYWGILRKYLLTLASR